MTRVLSAVLATATGGLFLLGMAGPAGAATTTLYVGGAKCSDTGPGSATNPFCTILHAGAVATAGQTVLVNSGSYSGTVSVANSGTAASPITFQPAAGASVTITGGADGFSIATKSYVTVTGFTITGTSSYGISVSGGDHITLSQNTVTGSGQQASGLIAAGIALSGTTSALVTGNHADNNSDSGIVLKGGTTSSTVSYNEASGNANGYQRNANGINVIAPANTIVGNVLHDNEDSGLQFYTGGDNNLAADNVSYNNGDHGIDDYNVTGGRLIGNTIYHNCTSGINVEGTSGNYLVENNISMDNAVYPAYHGIACSRRAGNIGIWDSAPATTTVNGNLVYLTRSGTMYVFGTAYSTLAAMQAATGQESVGLQANPQFLNAAIGNLQLAGTSPAIDSADSGASGEQATDALGVNRVDVPTVPNTGIGPRPYDDRGAYEYTGLGTPPPPNQPPTARLSVSPGSGPAPLTVTADGSASTDPEGQALNYAFDWGDGTATAPQSTPTASHTYAKVGTFTVTLTVTDPGDLTGSATATVRSINPYVGQIATNYSTTARTSDAMVVWKAAGVAAGNLVVVTANLTGTVAGPVTATDSAGDSYTVASDISDGAGHRLVVLSGVATAGLVTNQTITVSFPNAATNRVTADEVSGPTRLDVHAEAAGTGATFSSGPTPPVAGPNEYVFAAVGSYAATSAPTFAAGWAVQTGYAVSTDYLGRASVVSTGPNSYTGSGSATGTSWLAATVAFS